MIIGVTTTIQCDGDGCSKSATVTVRVGGEVVNSAKDWFAGTRHTFCARCRVRVRNQAAIEAETTELRETKVLPFVSSQNGGAPHAA
jgi:hypothetical protein